MGPAPPAGSNRRMNGWSYWGMTVWWWLFWVLLIVAFFSVLTPVPRRRARKTPLEILQARYAAGEVTTEEYEERKARLRQDHAA